MKCYCCMARHTHTLKWLKTSKNIIGICFVVVIVVVKRNSIHVLPILRLLPLFGNNSLRSLVFSDTKLLQSTESMVELLAPMAPLVWWLSRASFTCGSGSCSCEVLRELPMRNLSLNGAIFVRLLGLLLVLGYFFLFVVQLCWYVRMPSTSRRFEVGVLLFLETFWVGVFYGFSFLH